jgi:hypothetical protein
MKKYILIALTVFNVSCNVEPSGKKLVLDSLKKVYADKEIHINLHNTESGTKSMGSEYAYTEKDKLDFAFEIFEDGKYKVASEEQFPDVVTQQDIASGKEESDMVMIEQIQNPNKRGFVSAKLIVEFSKVPK